MGECSHDRILACYDACRSIKVNYLVIAQEEKGGGEGTPPVINARQHPFAINKLVSRPVSARVVPLIQWDILAHTRTVFSDHIAAQ